MHSKLRRDSIVVPVGVPRFARARPSLHSFLALALLAAGGLACKKQRSSCCNGETFDHSAPS